MSIPINGLKEDSTMNHKKLLNRRDFLRLSTLATAGAFLAACNQSTPGPSEEGEVKSAPPEPEDITLVYYDRTTQAPTWADRYNEVQNKVTVEVEIQPPNSRYEQLMAAITAGNAPDIIGVDCVQVGRFAQLSALADLTDMIPQDIKDRYFQNLVTTERHYGVFEGKLVGLPFWVDNSVCYYNKEMLGAAGGDPEVGFNSWNDHVTYGKAAIEELDVFGFSTGTVNSFLFGPWVWAQGGDFTNIEWTESRCDEEPVQRMYQFAHDIVNVDEITNDAISTDWGTMNDLFNNQEAMAVYGGGGNIGLVRQEFPDLWEKLGTCPIPGPEEGQISSFIGGNVASMSTQVEHVEEAVELLIWLTAEEEGMTVTGEVGYLPGCPSGLQLPIYQNDWDLYSAFEDALSTGNPAANDPRFDEVMLTPLNVAWQESIAGDKPIEQIVEDLHQTINQILQR
jgi:multiple sugar transport system substrate-binding protein